MKSNHSLLTASLISFAASTLLTLLPGNAVFAQDEIADGLRQLRAAEPDDYESIIEKIIGKSPEAADLSKAITSGVTTTPTDERKEKLVAGWSEWTATDPKGVTRPYQIFMPESLSGGEAPTAVIVHMHGAVGRPEFGTGKGTPIATGYAGFIWPNVAESAKLLIVCPVGRNECAWWTDNGMLHVDAVIRDVRRMVNFPEESIFGAGFSDGASGCYYRAMIDPEPFAGFIALNGHPRVAAESGKQVYLPNMAMSSTLAAMTQLDSLYPSKIIMPHILTAIQNDADVLTVSYPKMNHQPSYFTDQTDAIVSYIKNTKRTNRERLRWYAAEPAIGKVGGLEMLEFATKDAAEPMEEFNVMSGPGRLQLGVQFQAGTGKMMMVVKGSVAARAGMKAGDEMTHFDGKELDPTQLRRILRAKKYGESFTCKVQRDGAEQSLAGKFPEFVPQPVYIRRDPTGLAECRFVSGDSPMVKLTTKNVTKLRIWLPESMASQSEVALSHNGKVSTTKVNQITPKEILEDFARTGSSFVVRRSFIEIN